MLERLANLDRRWIFLFVAVAVVVPLMFPMRLPVKPSGPVIDVYRAVEALPAGSLMVVSYDYGPSTVPELTPMAKAVLRHAFRRGVRVVTLSIMPDGSFLGRKATNEIAAEAGKTYGVDYVNLGYKAGGEVLLRSIGSDFRQEFEFDSQGTRFSELPLMADVKGWKSFDLVLDLSSGKPGSIEYIRVVATQYDRPLAVGVTAVGAPEVYPYLNAGQLVGLLGGLRGAAEYEVLVGVPGTATPGMEAQSVVHFLIAAFIIFSNVIYFMGRRRRVRR